MSTKKNSTIMSMLAMSGIELISVIIASFKPLFLAINLRGLRILSIRKDFKKPSLYCEKKIENRLASTITKSSRFAGYLK